MFTFLLITYIYGTKLPTCSYPCFPMLILKKKKNKVGYLYSDSLLQEGADMTQADLSKKEIWAGVRCGAHLTVQRRRQ